MNFTSPLTEVKTLKIPKPSHFVFFFLKNKMSFFLISKKWEVNRKLIYECRCDKRLKNKDEGSTRLTYTGLRGELQLPKFVYCESIKRESYRQDLYMSVCTMKDYKLKMRNLHVSHTLLNISEVRETTSWSFTRKLMNFTSPRNEVKTLNIYLNLGWFICSWIKKRRKPAFEYIPKPSHFVFSHFIFFKSILRARDEEKDPARAWKLLPHMLCRGVVRLRNKGCFTLWSQIVQWTPKQEMEGAPKAVVGVARGRRGPAVRVHPVRLTSKGRSVSRHRILHIPPIRHKLHIPLVPLKGARGRRLQLQTILRSTPQAPGITSKMARTARR
jgi:hypothetical protein